MADLKTLTDTLLISVAGVDMKTAGSTTMYTVPTGKSCILTKVVVRNASGSLAGGTSYAFGSGANYDTFVTGQSLATVTATTHVFTIRQTAVFTISAAAAVIGMKITTGATNAATATIELFGYLV